MPTQSFGKIWLLCVNFEIFASMNFLGDKSQSSVWNAVIGHRQVYIGEFLKVNEQQSNFQDCLCLHFVPPVIFHLKLLRAKYSGPNSWPSTSCCCSTHRQLRLVISPGGNFDDTRCSKLVCWYEIFFRNRLVDWIQFLMKYVISLGKNLVTNKMQWVRCFRGIVLPVLEYCCPVYFFLRANFITDNEILKAHTVARS